MKEFIKNKKILTGILSTLILIILVVGGIVLFKKDNKISEAQRGINNYVAYIKINPSIKLEYSQHCENNKCDNPIVSKYELINDDAKSIFKDIDLLNSDKDLFSVIELITNTVKVNGIEFTEVEIFSNWDNVKTYIETSSNSNTMYKVNIKNDKELEDISKKLIGNQEEAKSENQDDKQSDTSNSENKSSNSSNKTDTNKNTSQQSTQNKKDNESKTEKESGSQSVKVDSEGYGDYLKMVHTNIGRYRYVTFVSTSKFGCKDAIDKKACKQSWMNYFAPKLEEIKREMESLVGLYNQEVKELEKLTKKRDELRIVVKECSSNLEATEAKNYNGYCKDSTDYLKYYEDAVKGYEDNIPLDKQDADGATASYKEYLTAYNIYKNLPY